MARENRVLDALVAPFQAFFRLEAAGGLAVMGSTALALAWANSPFGGLYETIFHGSIRLTLAGRELAFSVHHVTNDALMTLFFVVAGLEIKRELVQGELRTWNRAALPLVAAFGGMLVPAALYLAVNPRAPERAGWGVPMATDIAFALGCLALVKRRVPASLFVFLTALAIFDDIGAIAVIAVFYGQSVDLRALLVAAVLAGTLVLLGRRRVRSFGPYAVVGVLLWGALLRSGIHATLAGVVIGLSLPTERPSESAPSLVDRAMDALHGVVAYGIVPLFALANAGIALHSGSIEASPVALGAALGLTLGKPIGVFGATALAVALGLAPKPTGSTWPQILAVSCIAGIGFTMSLLVGNLAFADTRPLEDQAKTGVLAASFCSALLGIALLRLARPQTPTPPPARIF